MCVQTKVRFLRCSSTWPGAATTQLHLISYHRCKSRFCLSHTPIRFPCFSPCRGKVRKSVCERATVRVLVYTSRTLDGRCIQSPWLLIRSLRHQPRQMDADSYPTGRMQPLGTFRRRQRQGRLPRSCLFIAYALVLAAAAVNSSSDPEFLQELRGSDSREGERRQAKSSTRIVLVLGTGCPASFTEFELERQCSKYYSKYARFQPWLVPEAPCAQLPAIRPDREEREYRLGWHLNCDYRMAYTAVMRRAAPLLKAEGWHFDVVDYMSEVRERCWLLILVVYLIVT